MKKDLNIIIGEPFEEEWYTNHTVFDEDKINVSIPFVIRDSNGESVQDIKYQNGMMLAQIEGDEFARIVISIYDTDIFEAGEYTYEYHAITDGGKKIIDLEGSILVSEKKVLDPVEKRREVKPWDLLRSSNTPEGARVTEEVQKTRFDICKGCPEFIHLTGNCKRCGCFMSQKTKLAAASCPIGKWLAEV